jgi:dTDP-4-dehydrorhamnose 3,5-epimerase
VHGESSLKISDLEIQGLKLVELNLFRDQRGFFVERFNADVFRKAGLPSNFVQDNHSKSHPKVLRGLHYQYDPPQAKLVGVVRGKIWDVVVDLRRDSSSFMKSFGIELSAENGMLLWIPAGFAHGFCVLGDEAADVHYKVDSMYNPKGENGLLWNDPDLKIKWPIDDPIVSDRDKKLSTAKAFREQNR